MQAEINPRNTLPLRSGLAADTKFSVRLHSASLSTGGRRGFLFIYFRLHTSLSKKELPHCFVRQFYSQSINIVRHHFSFCLYHTFPTNSTITSARHRTFSSLHTVSFGVCIRAQYMPSGDLFSAHTPIPFLKFDWSEGNIIGSIFRH